MKLHYVFFNKNEEIILLPVIREESLLLTRTKEKKKRIADGASISSTAVVEFLNDSILDQ